MPLSAEIRFGAALTVDAVSVTRYVKPSRYPVEANLRRPLLRVMYIRRTRPVHPRNLSPTPRREGDVGPLHAIRAGPIRPTLGYS